MSDMTEKQKKEVSRRAQVIAAKFADNSSAYPKMSLLEIVEDVNWIIGEL